VIVSARELMPVVRGALGRGQRVRLTVSGSSMAPFLGDGDTVEIEPLAGLPREGDIVLVECSAERYVVHRVVERAAAHSFCAAIPGRT